MNINSPILLEQAVKDANTIVYFSHDYFARVTEKNDQLLAVAKYAKGYNAEKLLAITPVENVNFNTGSITDNPIQDLDAKNTKAM